MKKLLIFRKTILIHSTYFFLQLIPITSSTYCPNVLPNSYMK